MCKFEVGKTYKNKLGEEFLILFVSDKKACDYPVKTLKLASHTLEAFKSDGMHYETPSPHDLIPNLEPKIGHFYLDNYGDLRILQYSDKNEFRATAIFALTLEYLIRKNTWPKHYADKFELVRELSFAEAEKIISEYNAKKGGP